MFASRLRGLCLAAALLTAAVPASARVISYSPYTDHIAFPATQHRMNRHFVLVETAQQTNGVLLPPFVSFPTGQLVIYDSKGEQEPRVVFPINADQTQVAFSTVAVREENNVSTILIQTNANVNNGNPGHSFI